MDDKNFDKIIREKADAFQDTGHDVHALTDLRARLSNLPAKKNVWAGRGTAYMVGSMALFTLINFGIVWYFSEGRHAVLTDEIGQLKNERSQFISLQEELVELRVLKVDTVYIYRDLLTTSNTGVVGLHYSNDAPVSDERHTSSRSTQVIGDYKLLADDQKLSEELENFLVRNNLLMKGDHGERILIVQNRSIAPVADYGLISNDRVTEHSMPKDLPGVAIFELPESPIKPEKKRISNKMLWALEKHNHKGLDFQFGVEGMFHKSIYDVGSGDINGGMGFMTEIIFSPVVRLETGIHFGGRSYRINENEIQELPPDFFDDYPGYDDQIGQLIGFESDAKLVKLPVNLKAFGILDHNKKWYISAGLTPEWTIEQELEYKYALNTAAPPIGGAEYSSFIGTKQEISHAFYVTTLNLGAGTEVYLNKQLRWQIGVFYQKGLNKAGVENRKLHGFGVKSSIWFNKP